MAFRKLRLQALTLLPGAVKLGLPGPQPLALLLKGDAGAFLIPAQPGAGGVELAILLLQQALPVLCLRERLPEGLIGGLRLCEPVFRGIESARGLLMS